MRTDHGMRQPPRGFSETGRKLSRARVTCNSSPSPSPMPSRSNHPPVDLEGGQGSSRLDFQPRILPVILLESLQALVESSTCRECQGQRSREADEHEECSHDMPPCQSMMDVGKVVDRPTANRIR